jgi:clorobiocin biosynthesis protein CloN5
MQRLEVMEGLTEFIEQEILQSDHAGVEPCTPLLEWGILNSLSTAQLLAYIRERFQLFLPPERIVGANFKNLNALTDLIIELHEDAQARV